MVLSHLMLEHPNPDDSGPRWCRTTNSTPIVFLCLLAGLHGYTFIIGLVVDLAVLTLISR